MKAELTPLEIEIMQLRGHGKALKEISTELSMPYKTLEQYSKKLNDKMGFDNINPLIRHVALEDQKNGLL